MLRAGLENTVSAFSVLIALLSNKFAAIVEQFSNIFTLLKFRDLGGKF